MNPTGNIPNTKAFGNTFVQYSVLSKALTFGILSCWSAVRPIPRGQVIAVLRSDERHNLIEVNCRQYLHVVSSEAAIVRLTNAD